MVILHTIAGISVRDCCCYSYYRCERGLNGGTHSSPIPHPHPPTPHRSASQWEAFPSSPLLSPPRPTPGFWKVLQTLIGSWHLSRTSSWGVEFPSSGHRVIPVPEIPVSDFSSCCYEHFSPFLVMLVCVCLCVSFLRYF